jgi:hypothetical protein
MLPLGIVGMGRPTKLTRDEQYTLMTLWCIARSPLIFGGDMTKLDSFTLGLLTNPEVLAVNQDSFGNRELFHRDGLVAWVADVPGSTDKYVALFNTRDTKPDAPSARVTVTLADLGFSGECKVRDLWQQRNLDSVQTEFSCEIKSHGAGIFHLASK